MAPSRPEDHQGEFPRPSVAAAVGRLRSPRQHGREDRRPVRSSVGANLATVRADDTFGDRTRRHDLEAASRSHVAKLLRREGTAGDLGGAFSLRRPSFDESNDDRARFRVLLDADQPQRHFRAGPPLLIAAAAVFRPRAERPAPRRRTGGAKTPMLPQRLRHRPPRLLHDQGRPRRIEVMRVAVRGGKRRRRRQTDPSAHLRQERQAQRLVRVGRRQFRRRRGQEGREESIVGFHPAGEGGHLRRSRRRRHAALTLPSSAAVLASAAPSATALALPSPGPSAVAAPISPVASSDSAASASTPVAVPEALPGVPSGALRPSDELGRRRLRTR
mmetsp:Transcript_37458/g.112344  ORF Transcript_37458/g.112344 Transcript_37458/m.112344 type:complete len:331 (+) Transcript_37458:2629-3621(+)